eukprot:GCRY01005331.1.p1 GENE.GCRY01005331.1~~GCRY01005331.1.p1  ORF type:complete len:442 (+),score=78.98 GCRY01005331.1:55-1380(+)
MSTSNLRQRKSRSESKPTTPKSEPNLSYGSPFSAKSPRKPRLSRPVKTGSVVFRRNDRDSLSHFCHVSKSPLYGVCWGGSFIICCGGGGSAKSGLPNQVCIIDATQPNELHRYPSVSTLETGTSIPSYVTLPQNGSHLVVCAGQKLFVYDPKYETTDGDVKIDDFEQEKVVSIEMNSEMDFLKVCAVSPCNTLLAVGGTESLLQLLSFPSCTLKRTLVGHTDDIRSTSFSADSRLLITCGSDKICKIWNTESGKCEITLTCAEQFSYLKKEYSFKYACFSPVNKDEFFTVESCGKKQSFVSKWTLSRKENKEKALTVVLEKTTACHAYPSAILALSRDGQRIASGSCEGDIAVLDASTLKRTHFLEQAHALFVTGVDFSGDGTLLASVSADMTVRLTSLQHPPQSALPFLYAMFLIILLYLYIAFLHEGGFSLHSFVTTLF